MNAECTAKVFTSQQESDRLKKETFLFLTHHFNLFICIKLTRHPFSLSWLDILINKRRFKAQLIMQSLCRVAKWKGMFHFAFFFNPILITICFFVCHSFRPCYKVSGLFYFPNFAISWWRWWRWWRCFNFNSFWSN